jgi:hypothetical protein
MVQWKVYMWKGISALLGLVHCDVNRIQGAKEMDVETLE